MYLRSLNQDFNFAEKKFYEICHHQKERGANNYLTMMNSISSRHILLLFIKNRSLLLASSFNKMWQWEKSFKFNSGWKMQIKCQKVFPQRREMTANLVSFHFNYIIAGNVGWTMMPRSGILIWVPTNSNTVSSKEKKNTGIKLLVQEHYVTLWSVSSSSTIENQVDFSINLKLKMKSEQCRKL